MSEDRKSTEKSAATNLYWTWCREGHSDPALGAYLEKETWGSHHAGRMKHTPVAYLSAEFGLHESFAIYSGGLGVLAGDHLKSASDLGVPMIGVGLFYREGYFVQSLDAKGWQEERYERADPQEMGLAAVEVDGVPLRVTIPTRAGAIHAQVWRVEVGRASLLLLDTDVPENSEDDRALTKRLYGGNDRTRIRQELVLGVGGLRALRAMGVRPSVIHLNEGHSAFAVLELLAEAIEAGQSKEEALEDVGARVLFTTHTPVAAGHDRFSPPLALEHLEPWIERTGMTREELLGLGRQDPAQEDETFCMTVLALKIAHRANGVSFLHGRVSRRMWKGLWPERALRDVPIGHITNGVHVPTWMSPRAQRFFEERVDPSAEVHRPEAWAAAASFEDADLWSLRQALRRDLIGEVRRLAADQAEARGENPAIVDAMQGALDERALLIGFARRFATYKRAALVLQDTDLLDAIVNDPERPVNFVFAGKAHPRDEGGKRLLQRVFEVSRDPRFVGKVVCLSNYDMALGRTLTRGVDLWLNNPRRPLEASGTSGQKAVLNGVLNCSILDGWWAEGFDGENGFAIGDGEVQRDPRLQDRRDADALLDVLREEVVPLFFDRPGGLPKGWLARIKRAYVTLAWRFSAERMVRDYATSGYLPAGGVQLSDPR
ncbi:MAG: alpha-glucan family phosphorylase [Myxococcota bacterium]